jgi:predicted transcriptional regulator
VSKLDDLSRRERQIMDAIYKRRKATAADVHKALPDAPTYSAVRALLRVLEKKKHLRHRREGARYVFEPTLPRSTARRDAISRLVRTFFDGSAKRAASAFLESRRLTKEDLAELRDGIERRILSFMDERRAERLSRVVEARRVEARRRDEVVQLAFRAAMSAVERARRRADESVLRPGADTRLHGNAPPRPEMPSSDEPVYEGVGLQPFRRELDEPRRREPEQQRRHMLEQQLGSESLVLGRDPSSRRIVDRLACALLEAKRELEEQAHAADERVERAVVPTTSGSSPRPLGLAPSRPDPGGLGSTTSRPPGW